MTLEPKQSQVIKQLTQTNGRKFQALEKDQDLKRAMQKSDIKKLKGAKGQRELQQKEEEQKVEQRMRREWLKGRWEELREEEEEVEPREKWEELKVEEEVEQRVKEEDLKEEEEGEESRGLVSPRNATREVQPTTTGELWLTGRETEEWLDHQLDTD